MPNKPIVDKLQCRYCKLKPPVITIKYAKGKPLGECHECNRNRQLKHRLNVNFHLGLYRALPELVAANVKTLAALLPGTYSLCRFGLKTQIGYIIVLIDSIFVNIYNQSDLFGYDLFGIASYIGNLNAFIDCKGLTPLGLDGSAPIAPEGLQGLERIDVSERLIWYDGALLAKAIKLVKTETLKAKQANMAIALAKRHAKDES